MSPPIARVAIIFALLVGTNGHAQQRRENHLDTLPRAASSATTIVPIFSQLLLFSTPKDFRPANEALRDRKYVQQSIPAGESLDRWTEMITVTGEKDVATLQGVTPQKLAEAMASVYQASCPGSFRAASFGAVKVDDYDGFATVVGCGISDTDSSRSLAVLVVTIKGERDMYTLQWSQRGPPSTTPLVIDAPRWQDRLSRIAPVRLCAIVVGEGPPYPSCAQRR